MFNTNWPLNQNKSTSNVDWSALADTWMQQREQQAQWQQPLPPLPPPPPPQFLMGNPPIPPPGPMPIGMSFPPLPPTQLGIASHHHQLQVGSNTTQESLTMTNIENASWRPPLPPLPPPPPSLMIPSGHQWRPNMNNNQPIFPIQPETAPSFGGRNFWPPSSTGQQAIPPPVPPPVPLPHPPAPPQQPQMPPQFPAASYQHSPVDKRMMNTSFNTSIPSLMDLPSSYKQKPVPPPMPIPPVPVLPIDPIIPSNVSSGGNTNAKRRKIPAWLREELGRIEREKEKKMHNTSNNNNNNHSINDSSSKFDDDDDEEEETNNRTFNESTTAFNDDDDDNDDEENEQDDDEEPSSTQISSTPIVTRRSRFDDDKSTDPQLNVSAISKGTHPSSPSPTTTTTTTLIEDDSIDKEEQLMMKLRRALTELLLEVTNEELALLAKEVYLSCKAESSTPVIRKASGLSSLIQSFSGTDSDDEEEKNIQTIVKTTVITKSPIQPASSIKTDNDKSISKSSTKTSDDDTKTNKNKKKKSIHDRSPSKKHHHKKHRHHSSSSSSSSNSSQSRSQKKKKSSNHDSYSEHNKSKKYDDRGRKR